MNEKNINSVPSKRGRKPLGAKAMTAAERKRLSRTRKATEGVAEIMIQLRGGTLNFVDQFVEASGMTRPQVIAAMLDFAIARIANAVAEADRATQQGITSEATAELLHQMLNTTPREDVVQQFKEVMSLK